jgi:hypothetical protein
VIYNSSALHIGSNKSVLKFWIEFTRYEKSDVVKREPHSKSGYLAWVAPSVGKGILISLVRPDSKSQRWKNVQHSVGYIPMKLVNMNGIGVQVESKMLLLNTSGTFWREIAFRSMFKRSNVSSRNIEHGRKQTPRSSPRNQNRDKANVSFNHVHSEFLFNKTR